MKRLSYILSLFFLVPVWAEVEKMPDLKDSRDGSVYKTVQIGDQRWMAENMRLRTKGSFCYENKEYNCDRFGRLYQWAAAMKLSDYYNSLTIEKLGNRTRGLCPDGWHLPTGRDWSKLRLYVGKKGKSDGVGVSLRSKDHWEVERTMPFASDEFGFNAVPSGERYYGGEYMDMFRSAAYWSSTEYDAGGAYFWRISYDSRTIEKILDSKENGFAIRCVDDSLYAIKEPPPPPPKVEAKVVKVQGRNLQTIHIGEQVWMKNNLDVKVLGSFCYEDKEENCEKYGRLYTWTAAVKLADKFMTATARDSISKVKPKGICPNGWHIPTALDFKRLDAYLKDIDEAVSVGTNLRSRTDWDESESALLGQDGFGFAAFAYGSRDTSGAYSGIRKVAKFWTGSEGDSLRGIAMRLSYDVDELLQDSSFKGEAYSIRCMMDPPDDDELYDSTAIFDKRDENRYRTVTIGDNVWMAENLRFAAKGSFCYEDKDNRCKNYGRLYPWHVAMGLPANYVEESMSGQVKDVHQGVCPDGWHIPKNEEWQALEKKVAELYKGQIGSVLKNKEGWNNGGAPITAESGFNILPAGNRFAEGEYTELGSSAYFWVAQGGDGMGAVYWNIINAKNSFSQAEDFDGMSFSVRCVKNK